MVIDAGSKSVWRYSILSAMVLDSQFECNPQKKTKQNNPDDAVGQKLNDDSQVIVREKGHVRGVVV